MEKDLEIRVNLAFLEPGLGGRPARAGDEIAIGAPSWTSPTEGRMAESVWRLRTVATFSADPARSKILDASPNLTAPQTDAWRHRHGYVLTSGGYVWDSMGDVRPSMDAALGKSLDQALAGALKLWTARRAQTALPASTETALDDPDAVLVEKVRLRYDENGLVGHAFGDFFIRLWGIPVRVRYEVEPHHPDHDDNMLMWISGDARFEYGDGEDAARTEWRRRHGYSLGPQGYAWDADFPSPRPDAGTVGPELDAMFDRCAQYWAEVAASQAVRVLDERLKDEIHWRGVPLADSSVSGQSELSRLNESRRWPQ